MSNRWSCSTLMDGYNHVTADADAACEEELQIRKELED